MLPTFHHKFRIPSARAAWWNYQDAAAYFITICTQNKRHFFGEITVETPCMASPPQTPDMASPQFKQKTPCMASPQFTQKTPDMASLRATEIGKIAEEEWLKTPIVRPDMNLYLDEFVVMPNHFHAIIIIGENKYNHRGRDAMHGVSSTNAMIGVSSTNAMIGVSSTNAIHAKDARHGVSSIHAKDAMHGVSTINTTTNPTTADKKMGPQLKNLSSIIRGYKSAVTCYARKNSIVFDWQARFHDRIIRNEDAYQTIKNYIKNNPRNWKNDTFHC